MKAHHQAQVCNFTIISIIWKFRSNNLLTTVRFASLLSGGFTSMAVKKKKLAKRTSVRCLDLDLNGKIPGVTSDGNFSSYLIGRS